MGNSIRLGGVKKIEVNDNGEYITLPVGDDRFLKAFYQLLDKASNSAQEVKMDENDITGSMDAVIDFDQNMKEQVDELFGAETCRKVFGDILPGAGMFIEFFFAVLPFLEEDQKRRIETMNKYGAGRMGSRV